MTQDRAQVWGSIIDGQMQLTSAGRMVEGWWQKLSGKFQWVEPGSHVVMPNHFHGIVWLANHMGKDVNSAAGPCTTLSEVIQWFKTMTTNAYIGGVKHLGWPEYPGRLWQRNYYEHIVRDEAELAQICIYIEENPVRWDEDEENLR